MPIEVYDARRDVRNVVVEPEIRCRFQNVQSGPMPLPHSHDVAAETFVVLQGKIEFEVEGERAIVGPGQLLYVPAKLKHGYRAVEEPCFQFLCVTPHVEPTHTRYDAHLVEQPPRYGAFRGSEPDPHAELSTADLARRHAAEARTLAELAQQHAVAMERHAAALTSTTLESGTDVKREIDEAWPTLRDVLRQVRQVELAWNALAPRATPPATPPAG